MRILIASPCFPPLNSIASLRVHAFAAHWAAAGEEVTVVSTSKRPESGPSGNAEGFVLEELSYRVPALYEWLRSRQSNGEQAGRGRGLMRLLGRLRDRRGLFAAVRMPDLTDYWVGPAMRWCRSQPPWDVVVSSSGPYTSHLVALALKRAGHAARWVADFRDLWVDNHLYRGIFPFSVRERMLEQQCLQEADLVVTVSPELARTLQSKTRRAVRVIYNGFDEPAASGTGQGEVFPDDRVARLVYTGTLYEKGQDPTPLLKALARLRRHDPDLASALKLVVAGRGGDQWSRLARAYAVSEFIDVRGIVSRADALGMQRGATGLLLLDWMEPKAGVLTGKVFEYLSAEAPILVVGGDDRSSAGRLVERSGLGVHLATDVARIHEALRALVKAPQCLHREPCRDFISKFSRRRQSLRLLELMRSGDGSAS